jgi:hypothetical protein
MKTRVCTSCGETKSGKWCHECGIETYPRFEDGRYEKPRGETMLTEKEYSKLGPRQLDEIGDDE